jgi:glyoxylase-like metal-dependent hydrolase (beta-lactamase superfamily II)
MEIQRLVVGPLRTNCYVLSEGSSCIIIDPGGDQDIIIKRLEESKLVPSMILATHGHFDHILSVNPLKDKFDVPFLVSEKDNEIIDRFTEFVKKYFNMDPGPPPIPDRYLSSKTKLKLGDKTITISETPGHTPGSCSFFIENIMFTGDFIFKGSIGRTDFGGSYTEMTSSIRWTKKLRSDIKIFPGHGDSTTLENERLNNPFFIEIL